MTDIGDTASELASLWPALAAALARDTAGEGASSGTAPAAATVVNADVLAAMLTLGREIPAAIRRACDITGEPWRNRELEDHLRQVPRLAGRMRDLGRIDGEKALTRETSDWLRMVKRAIGLRRPDTPVGYACPYADITPETHQAAAMLFLAGAEGFLRPGSDGVRVEWVTSGLIYCASGPCGASWDHGRWPQLGRMLEMTSPAGA